MKKLNSFLVLTMVLLFLTSTGSALDFNVEVSALLDSSEYNIEYTNETKDLQTIKGAVENRGSIGCSYRLMAEFEYGNETYTRYSESHDLWPGGVAEAELNFIPMNYTGPVETTLYTDYCDTQKEVESFSFNVTELTVSNATVTSETREVNSSGSVVGFEEVEEGLLVPEESPPYWKTASSEVKNGEAVLSYDAPIFREGVEMSYTVLNNDSEVVGTTEVLLEPRDSWIETVKPYLIPAVLAVSLLFNAVLLVRRRKAPEK